MQKALTKKKRAVKKAFDTDAVDIGALYDDARKSFIGGVYSLLECGKRLTEKKDGLKHGEWLPWLEANKEALGFGWSAAKAIMKAARENSQLAGYLTAEEALAISRQMWGHDKTIATKHTGDQESYTPADIIEDARFVLSGIDLDPASNPLAQETVQAGMWYGVNDDGLAQKWAGTVFLNPPYAYPLVEHFITKLIDSYEDGSVTAAVLLTNNSADTSWWQVSARTASATCMTKGRVNFYKVDGTITQPTNGQTFFYFGDDVQLFVERFEKRGIIYGRPIA